MQNKKTLLKRLMVIYITFFIVLVASLLHGVLPSFAQGCDAGTQVGNDIAKNWEAGTPHRIYLLGKIPVRSTQTFEITAADGMSVEASIASLSIIADREAPDASVAGIAFGSIGGNPWFYVASIAKLLFLVAIIVLMFRIIHSLRRSVREERPLDRRNVGRLRTIGALTIAAELLRDVVNWRLASHAAELLSGTVHTVDDTLHISYTPIIMGILILFAAEVFAIGQNLSEEQKLTI